MTIHSRHFVPGPGQLPLPPSVAQRSGPRDTRRTSRRGCASAPAAGVQALVGKRRSGSCGPRHPGHSPKRKTEVALACLTTEEGVWVFRFQGQQIPRLALLWAALSDITAGSCRWGSKQERLGQVPAWVAATLLRGPQDPGHRGGRCPWWGKARVQPDTPWGPRHLHWRSLPLVKTSSWCSGGGGRPTGTSGTGHTVRREVTITEGSGWTQRRGARGCRQAVVGGTPLRACHLMLGLTSCSTRR